MMLVAHVEDSESVTLFGCPVLRQRELRIGRRDEVQANSKS